MQPMLRTADDQDEGHMIVGSHFAAPDDYLALGLRPEAALLCRGCALSRRTIRDPRYDGVLRTGQCRTNGRWPFRWSSLPNCSTSPATTGHPWTHALSYSTLAQVRSVGNPLQPTFVWMNDRQPEGSPEIGELWYGPWHGFQPGGVILRAAPGRSSSLGRSIRPRR